MNFLVCNGEFYCILSFLVYTRTRFYFFGGVVSLASFPRGSGESREKLSSQSERSPPSSFVYKRSPRFTISSFQKIKYDFLFFAIFDFAAIFGVLSHSRIRFDLSRYFLSLILTN